MWTYQTGATVFSSPVVGTDGTVYIGSHDKNIYAFVGATGVRKWPTPFATNGSM